MASNNSYPPALDDNLERDRLVEVIKDWSIAHGLAVWPAPAVIEEQKPRLAIHAPVTLFPSPFPKSCFEEAKSIQTTYNELYAAIARDEEFLGGLVKEVAGNDEFIADLWDVHVRVKKEGYVQPLALGLFRSDYMVHQDSPTATPQIKQVEFNTIASSFGGLSAKTSDLHRFLSQTEYPLLKDPSAHSLDLPANNSVAGLAAGLQSAFHAYGKSSLGHPTCVIFLVQSPERNVFDQRHLEYQLAASGVPIFRLPFSQTLARTEISAGSPARQLLYRPEHNPQKVYEVAVVYMRCGYGPGDYPSKDAWEARYQIERSNAISCPTVLTQLAGMKKVQQVLATPPTHPSSSPVMRSFVSDDTKFDNLWKTFTNIYPMDTSEAGQHARKLATDPEACKKYVMKPQREGGGNNFYRSAIPAHLKEIPEAQWSRYILMELITPPPLNNIILRNGELEQGGVICELGVYGTCLWDRNDGKIVHNAEAGYLLRTKGDQSEEGGVAAGYGCMDSVCFL
ncbi:putative glutathione synthetase [Diplogelasinospora grovesii]|uniref:Glutathione synthetase n=1 Tax=Diplogelasinospora grovesii TaxID=303347 RepID=A0AAN6S976_9PEZI|nr:putative glutathione synthetase [Diplogelasinospora grovesii]